MVKFNKKILLLAMACLMSAFSFAQGLCEPIYSIERVNTMMGNVIENSQGGGYRLQAVIGQGLITANSTDDFTYSVASGFFADYLTEPKAPLVNSSDGDFQEWVVIDWVIEGDSPSFSGPPVTSAEATLYRNGYILTTLPIDQRQYLDFNVFPGEYYTYGVTVKNNMGESQTDDDVGFLNPNGMITGHIETPSGNPIYNSKVKLSPNLGRCVKFNGDGYLYWFDDSLNTNRQFTGIENDYTIETWFRSVNSGDEMTIFSAVDSASINHSITVSVTDEGNLSWSHLGTSITTADPYIGPGEDWHHLALVKSGSELTMYMDGFIVGQASGAEDISKKAEFVLGKHSPREPYDYYSGRLDDFRIWSYAREWDDLRNMMDITLSGEEDSLSVYYKFDEFEGDVIFDLTDGDQDGKTCRVDRDEFIAPVYLGALTDENGNYAIKGIYYGSGTNFTITPSKSTAIGRSLKFDGVDDYIDFVGQRVDLSESYTLEGWFKTASDSTMALFFTKDFDDDAPQLSVILSDGKVSATHLSASLISSETYHDNLWHHYAVSCDSSTLTLYVDSEVQGSAAVSSAFNGDSKLVIARSNSESDYYSGYLDEIRIWNLVRTAEQIGGTMMQVVADDSYGLVNYWKINDGTGSFTTDEVGQATGTLTGMTEEEAEDMWSKDIPLNEFFDHWYEPESRQAAMNNSNTIINEVNYTDESLIPVSGYVKFENTACFLGGVEILVNEQSLFPPIVTDADGKFIVEIEPGATGKRLSCSFRTPGTGGGGAYPEELHEFLPPLIELPMMVQPISGLYFNDKTTRTIDGVVAGGTCEHPINPPDGNMAVKIESVDGCFEVELEPNEVNGSYEYKIFPPLIYTVELLHPISKIQNFFMADVIDVEKDDASKNFIYRDSLEVEMGNLYRMNVAYETRALVDSTNCGSFDETADGYLDGVSPVSQYTWYQLEYDVFETYGDNICIVDIFNISVSDQLSDQNYSYSSTDPNLVNPYNNWYIDIFPSHVNLLGGDSNNHPYQNSISLIVDNEFGFSALYTKWFLTTGLVQIPESNFQTDTEAHPWFILRVPPGDGSYSYYESGYEKCKYNSYEFEDSQNSSSSITAHFGNKLAVSLGMPGATQTFTTENVFDIGGGFEYNHTQSDLNESETCITTTETYTAYGDGLITGDEATVFVGGGESFAFGLVKRLTYEDCVAAIDTTVSIDQEGVSSTYVHSKYYIQNVLMPNAMMLYNLGDLTDSTNYNIWENWHDALIYDSLLIASAISDNTFAVGDISLDYVGTCPDSGEICDPFDPFNIECGFCEFNYSSSGETNGYLSVDAGASVEFSYATSAFTSSTKSSSEEFAEEVFGELGLTFNSFGFSAESSATFSQNSSNVSSNGSTASTTIGFVFDDDDPGDGFLIQIKKDENNMPVFSTTGGQSSCPWEQNTVRRQLATLSAESAIAYDIPPDESAVFTLLLGNASETGEDNYYKLVAEMTTLNGASIKVNGQPIGGGGQVFWLTAGEQVSILVEVNRGPIGYEFDNISLELQPPCEADIAANLGAPTQNAAGIILNAHFQEPCSESNIANIEDGWLIDSSQDGDTLWVEINEYNFPVDTLMMTSLDLQYRSGGSGNWFTAHSVTSGDLNMESVLMPFNVDPSIIIDGNYELRAQAQCTGGTYPGTSEVVNGFIDRTPPLVLGLPEPVNGILGPEDLIQLTFNEDVQCGEINAGAGDIQLWNTVTSQAVDFEFTCGYNIITIEPSPTNIWLENQTFRAEVHNLEDMYGNVRDEAIVWEFFINRNPIEWLGANIDNIVIYEDEEYSTTRQLVNNGGSNRSWEMIGGREGAMPSGDPLNLPTWLAVDPMNGTLTPGASQEISISLLEGLDFGSYQTTIYAAGTMGDEPMIIDIRKLCDEPGWSLNTSDYQYTMNITATLSTEGELSADEYDIVGVFAGDELRGVAEITYLPALADIGVHPYELFLTIYSNITSGEELTMRVWDASECTELGWVEENYLFEANSTQGTPTTPVTITATSQIIAHIDYPSGWTWFSMNLQNNNMGLNSVFANLNLTSSDIIKDQTSYAQYVPGAGWVGPLSELNNQSMYLINLDNANTLEMIGYAVNVELDTIDVVSGWNWIGYTPQLSIEVNAALNSLSSATGDIIKSQFFYAQYVEGIGWLGSLSYMNTELGYMLKSLYPGELVYPFTEGQRGEEENQNYMPPLARMAPGWQVDPERFEHNMTITGTGFINDAHIDNPMDMIGAYAMVDDGAGGYTSECRGIAQPIFIEALDSWTFFMMIYGNTPGDELEFRLFDAGADHIWGILESIEFNPNIELGTVLKPYSWNALPQIGDVNFDGELNVLDIVATIQYVLGSTTLTDIQFMTADLTGDGLVNMFDIVLLVNEVLGIELVRSNSEPVEVELAIQGNNVRIKSENTVAGLQMDILGISEFISSLENYTRQTETGLRVVFVSTEGSLVNDGVIFTSEGLHEHSFENVLISDRNGQELSFTVKMLPEEFALSQNYPNPFNPTTIINFGLPLDSEVHLVIYDIMGREVATLVDGFMEAGYHKQQWNSLNNEGKTVANGMYLYQLTTSGGDESFGSVKKMVLLK